MVIHRTVHLVGYASGFAGADAGSADGPSVIKHSTYLAKLDRAGVTIHWEEMVASQSGSRQSSFQTVSSLCESLGQSVISLVKNNQFFVVLGGDHSSAIGTWSGASHALKEKGSLGLIWVDAHMDSHTPETSQSGNIHGMPLASLLGQGNELLTTLFNPHAKVKPEHVCLIGVRSFEEGEAALLKQLNVRVFYMDEVNKRGLDAVFAEAIRIASNKTVGYGISLDVDSIDPRDAPGTGVQEENGLSGNDVLRVLASVATDARLIGVEIVEFDPHQDKEQRTEKLIAELIAAVTLGEK